MNKNLTVANLITEYGGQVRLANALGLKQGTIAGWLNLRHGISEHNALKIEKLTNGKFKATELCPRLAEIEAMEVPSNPNPQTQNKNPKR